MHRLAPLALLLALACRTQERPSRPPAASDLLSSGSWVDLSHDFSTETIYWPTAKPFMLEVVSAQRTPAGYYYAANNFSTSEHGGTHLDAPIHFAEGKHTADQVPLDRLVGPAVVVDVVARADADADYRLDVTALEEWERSNGRILDGAIVLVDAAEGPMPQTKFVVGKALKIGLKPIVCINKVDKSDARPAEVVDAVFDLFAALDASDAQLDFPIVYGSAKQGWMAEAAGGPKDKGMAPLFELIVRHVPPPRIEPGPFRMLGTLLEANPYLGRLITGRIFAG